MKFSEQDLRDKLASNPALARRNPGIRSNPDCAGSSRAVAELESTSRNATLVPAQVQKRTGQSVLVRVTSFRRRLLDEDNLAEKYHVDLCRYAGILSSDDPTQTQIQVSQIKVGTKDREFVRIEVIEKL